MSEILTARGEVDIASIEAQIDSSVPYYVFHLITEIKLLRARCEQAERAIYEAIEACPVSRKQDFLDAPLLALVQEQTRWGMWWQSVAEAERIKREQAERERDEARTFGLDAARRYNDLLAAQRVTCAFCGMEYPVGTPRHGDGSLTEHILVCEQHPMRLIEIDRDEARAQAISLGEECAAKAERIAALEAHVREWREGFVAVLAPHDSLLAASLALVPDAGGES